MQCGVIFKMEIIVTLLNLYICYVKCGCAILIRFIDMYIVMNYVSLLGTMISLTYYQGKIQTRLTSYDI